MPRLTTEQIKKELEQVGMYYVEGEYKNLDSLLKCECEYGHTYMLSVRKARKGFSCPSCLELEKALEQEKDMDILETKKFPRILGLDQSTTICGYCVIENGKILTYGTHEEKNDDIIHRIMKHKQWMQSIIDIWEIDQVVLEEIYMSRNAKTALMLGQVLGALQIAAYEQLGNKPLIVSPGTWRSHCNIKGRKRREQKENTQNFIKEKFNITASFDCADAICIAVYGNYLFSFEKEIYF